MYVSEYFLLVFKNREYLILNKCTRIYQFGQPRVKKPGNYYLLTEKTGCLTVADIVPCVKWPGAREQKGKGGGGEWGEIENVPEI